MVKLKGRKYTTENKILALAFYKQSRRAYSKLREFFALPTLYKKMLKIKNIKINLFFIIFFKLLNNKNEVIMENIQ
jgi:hypothetical protein